MLIINKIANLAEKIGNKYLLNELKNRIFARSNHPQISQVEGGVERALDYFCL